MNIPYAFKECSKCGEWLVANKINFYKEKRGKWGLKSRCKKCDNKRKKNHYKNNKEHFKEYYENNKEYIKEYNKEYKKNNPQVIFNNNNKRRNKLENQGRGIDKIQWYEMMMFFDFKCAYSNINLGCKENRSVDHILAIDNGGLNEPWNCIPMVKSYNSSKNKRIDVLNWYLEQEYFDTDRLNKIVEWQIYAYEKWGGEEFGELVLITDLFEEEK